MPHYKDGTPVQIGDIARGKGYNLPYPIQGVVTRVVPESDACGITVHGMGFGNYPIDPANLQAGQFATTVPGAALAKMEDGRLLSAVAVEDNGTCSEFELVYRPEPEEGRPHLLK